jgi:DNA-binding response OmpR family regulator
MSELAERSATSVPAVFAGQTHSKRAVVVGSDIEAASLAFRKGSVVCELQPISEGPGVISMIDGYRPQLVVLGPGLSDGMATRLCTEIRRQPGLCHVPVVVLSCRTDEATELEALEAGADDYMPAHAPAAIVWARLRRLLGEVRSPGVISQSSIMVGPLTIDTARFCASCEGKPLQLTHFEFRLLEALAVRADRIRSIAELARALTVDGEAPDEASVRTRIYSLRRKLGMEANALETVRGAGYRLRSKTPATSLTP